MKWQPIETAPKDKTVIILGFLPHWSLNGSRRVYEGRWSKTQNTWTSVNGFMIFSEASHWMPLPQPPESAA